MAFGNFGHAPQRIRGQDEPVVAELASVLGSEVDLAVVNESETLSSLAGQSRESVITLNAESHAIVLDAVGDCARDAAAPVWGLGKTIGAFGADVGIGNVQIAVVDLLEAAVLHQNEAFRALEADGQRSVLRVGETSRDVSNQGASRAVLQVVSLLTLDASAEIVDSSTEIVLRLNAASG